MRGLGVALKGKAIYLYYQDDSSNRKTFFVTGSKDGFNFNLQAKTGVIKVNLGVKESISATSDFRLSKIKGGFLLLYIKDGTLQCARSKDLEQWKKITKRSIGDEPGMVVPNYTYEKKYVMYLGINGAIHLATSENLVSWDVEEEPLLKSRKGMFDNKEIMVANVTYDKKKITVWYYARQGRKNRSGHALGVAVFDKKNPAKLKDRLDKPFWQTPDQWNKKGIDPIGLTVVDKQVFSYWNDGKTVLASLQLLTKKKKPSKKHPILSRFEHNPIIEPIAENEWESRATFNTAAILEDGRVHLLYRAIGDRDLSALGYASSSDGLHFDIRLPHPVYIPRESFEGAGTPQIGTSDYSPYMSGGGGWGGCEDPRISKIDDRIYLTYVAYDGVNPPRIALSSIGVDDFKAHRWSWTRPVLISRPGEVNKNAVILPETVNGKYVIFHRVYPDILVDFVDDLAFDGKTKWLEGHFKISPRPGFWDSHKIGAGAPPIKTDKGWLMIYQAVGKDDRGKYKIGAMLLDLQDPVKVLARSAKPILSPDKWYENAGHKAGVVYSCGAVVIGDQLLVYYGGADTVVNVAGAKLKTFLKQLEATGDASLEKINA